LFLKKEDLLKSL